ncbi:MAG TPA: hypothetical protein VL098_00980 [Flavipsychrobacter sp.]|nr:hypothetical protein [Flavipsychrobacter sp.]
MHFRIIVISLAVASILSSCKKEDNKQNDTKKKRSDLLIGKWKVTQGGKDPGSLIPIDEQYSYLDEYKSNGEGTSTFLADSSVDPFTWMVSASETYIRQIRSYEGEPDTMYLEFYSFEKNKFIVKDTSFGSVNYGVFERQ